jgi:feruloyl esterase
MLHRAVLAACDAKDGVKDGLIADPLTCHFDPAALICHGVDRQDCLTAPQIGVVRRIYTERKAAIGSELSWIDVYLHDADPAPPPNPYAARGDGAVEESLVSPADPDLTPFRAHGGKLILAHGWADPSVMPGPTVDFYRLATATMGGQAATQAFFRLFMVPGMRHCSGGEGAYGIDYIAALENWVEKKQAPEKLIGVHPKPGVKLDFLSIDLPFLKPDDFAFTRAYFPYPLQAVYAGHGNPDDQASYVPGSPGASLSSAAVSSGGADLAVKHLMPAARLSALRDEMDRTERWSTASGFPHGYIVAGIAAAMLIDLDAEELSHDNETALLDQIAAQPLSVAEQAALPIIRPQIQNDQ